MGRSDSIRSMGFQRYSRARNSETSEQGSYKLDGTLWVTGTYHIIFSIGSALRKLGYPIMSKVHRLKPLLL
jgi:hypothetical protein